MHSEGRYGVERGLVGWWRLMINKGGAADLIGTNNATLNGGASFAGSGGREYMAFDGVNDYLTVGSGFTGLVGAERFTYACWLYQNNTSDAIIFDRNQDAGAGNRLLYIYRYSNNIRVVLGDADETYFADSVFPATTWVHMAVRWDKAVDFDGGIAYGSPQCFFNGVEVSSYTGNIARATALPSTNHTMFIGVHSNGTNLLPFPGRMSDLRIYDRALSAAEVARLARIY